MPTATRSALFVDFDNVYIGLRQLDPAAAEAFASEPGHWLAALEAGEESQDAAERRFLVRACYLNPSVYAKYRPNFTRAGFRVVDCPSLTQQGKSSADINLVLDAVDALGAETRYDEFVIVSADADFTPLALRCRAADRRVTIIAASPAAAAYRAVADVVVTADDLVDLITPDTPAVPAEPVTDANALQRQVVAVTDTPGLTTSNYRALLTALAEDVRDHPFERNETAKRVRDACQAEGANVGKSSVTFVISGIALSGVDLARKPGQKALAEAWASSVVGLCRGARMELTVADVAAIRRWVSGGLLAS